MFFAWKKKVTCSLPLVAHTTSFNYSYILLDMARLICCVNCENLKKKKNLGREKSLNLNINQYSNKVLSLLTMITKIKNL